MFRKFRILILLLVLATVALGAWRANARLTAWEHTVHVAVYPIAADDSPATAAFIAELHPESFAEIDEWLQQETRRYGKDILQPLALRVAPRLRERPPPQPAHATALDAALWSLKLRWWAWQHDQIDGPKPQVRLFVLFHDPALTLQPPHSTGLSKGGIGIIHAFAHRKQRRQNNVVIAHELLHTFGASDKYHPASTQPIWPDGYAEPERQPRWPQAFAEIMGGRIPLDEQRSEIPPGLGFTLIGQRTAEEIGLRRSTGR